MTYFQVFHIQLFQHALQTLCKLSKVQYPWQPFISVNNSTAAEYKGTTCSETSLIQQPLGLSKSDQVGKLSIQPESLQA